MKVREIPFFDRPGYRLKQKGADALSDSELLSIILWRGGRDENAIDLAHRTLAKFNFNKLSELSFAELMSEYQDEVKAMKIQAMFEIFRRTNKLEHKAFGVQIQSAEDVYRHFADELQGKKKEYFYAVLLDTKNRVISKELISVGLLDASLIHPREVFAAAVKNHAKSIILVHNHPSGESAPSKQDEEVTILLKKAGELLGIPVLDHLIIGLTGFTSMKEI